MSEPGAPASHPRQGLTLAALVTAALAFSLQQIMVAPALPEIQRELGTSTTAVSFLITGYLAAASVAIPVFGRLGDMLGKDRLLTAALAIYALGSLAAALAGSIATLIAARVVSGVGGASMVLAIGIVRDELPPARVPAGVGLIAGTIGIGGGAGLVLSGVIVDGLSYRWLFWVGLALVICALAATRLWVPRSPVRSPAPIDWGGAVLMALGLVAVLVAISEASSWGWGSARALGLIAAGIAVLALWLVWEARQSQPLVDVEMLAQPAVLTTNLSGLLVGFGMFALFILVPRFAQTPEAVAGYGFDASLVEAGLFLLPALAAMPIAGPIAGAVGGRAGAKAPLIAGAAAGTLGFALMAVADDRPWTILAGTAAVGVGIGSAWASLANLTLEAVDRTRTGVATGVNTVMRMIGGSLGGQATASILAGGAVAATGLPSASAYTAAFAACAVAMGLALMVALAIPPREGRRASSAALAAAAAAAAAAPATLGESARAVRRRRGGETLDTDGTLGGR